MCRERGDLAGPVGFVGRRTRREPTTYGLRARRSNQAELRALRSMFCTILKIFHQAVGRRLSGYNHPYVVLDMAGHSSLIGIVGLAHSPEKGLYSGSHCADGTRNEKGAAAWAAWPVWA